MRQREIHLTDEEIAAFRQSESQTRDVRELKRLQIVRLYGTGESVATIQQLTGCGPKTPAQWSRRYRRGGLDALRTQWQGGNANKLTADQRTQLAERLHQSRPIDLGLSERDWWTVRDVQTVVQQWYGVRYKDQSRYQALLKASGFTYQRTTKVYRHRPSEQAMADFEAELEKK